MSVCKSESSEGKAGRTVSGSQTGDDPTQESRV